MEVLHEGALERCIHVTDTKKEWKKGYFVFKKYSSSGSKTLEFYKDCNWKKQEPKGVVNLFTGYTVTSHNNTKKKYMFELVTVDKTYELYASSEASREKWINVLNEILIIKSYDVLLLEYPPKAYDFVKDIQGLCQLQISEKSIILLSAHAPSITWIFSIIRRYKSQDGCFVIEVGRKALTGDGEFSFKTDNAAELFDVLDKAVKNRSRSREIEQQQRPQSHQQQPMSHSPLLAKSPSDILPHFPNKQPFVSTNNCDVLDGAKQNAAGNNSNFDDYSHIQSLGNQHAAMREELESDYDRLFSNNRIKNHRQSDPVLSKSQPNQLGLSKSFNSGAFNTHFQQPSHDSTKKLSGSSIVVNPDLMSEEVYVDMAGETTNKGEQKRPPQPPPRALKPTTAPLKPTSDAIKEPLKKTLSSPNEENPYDSLNTLTPALAFSEKHPKEYDQLFHCSPQNVIAAPYYSHLSQTEPVQEDAYDVPKNIPSKPEHKTKKPIKPVRPAPLVPPVASSNHDERRALNPKSPQPADGARAPPVGSVVLKLNRNPSNPTLSTDNQKDSFNNGVARIDKNLYDSPNPEVIRYNQVGDIIPGEYQKNHLDQDGYVKVPNETDEGQIYQIPRGEEVQCNVFK